MKTKIAMFIALLFAITIGANAQGMQRRHRRRKSKIHNG